MSLDGFCGAGIAIPLRELTFSPADEVLEAIGHGTEMP
jgi:hypothetical protein